MAFVVEQDGGNHVSVDGGLNTDRSPSGQRGKKSESATPTRVRFRYNRCLDITCSLSELQNNNVEILVKK